MQVRLENEGASTTCLRIFPDQKNFPIGSGIENGIELLLDLETFDNGEFGVDEDALKIMVTDEHDYPLLDLNGFTIKPGVATNIKIRPVLFDATTEALDNFDDYNRRCVDARNPNLENLLQGMHLPYSKVGKSRNLGAYVPSFSDKNGKNTENSGKYSRV